MVKLSPETQTKIQNLMEELLEIINEAKRAEFLLLETFGETSSTEIHERRVNRDIPTG